MQDEPTSRLSSYETMLDKADTALAQANAVENKCEQALTKAHRNESNAKGRLSSAEMQFKSAKEKLDAAKAEFTRAHENRLRKTDELSNVRVTRHLLTVDKYCLEFLITFISQKTDDDREACCMQHVEFAEGALIGLHDALLRNVTPLFDPTMVMKTKSNIIWQYWANIMNTLGDGFNGGEELVSTIDRYLHLWCENRVPPRPCEDATFRQMVDTEWSAVRRGLSEFREFLRTRKGNTSSVAAEETRTAMEAEAIPQTPPAISSNEVKQIMVEEFKGIKRYIAKRTHTHKKGSAPGPKMTSTHYNDLKRVHEYVKQGYALYKACGIVDAENKNRPDKETHYGSAESMRSEYPKWLEKERKAGRVD